MYFSDLGTSLPGVKVISLNPSWLVLTGGFFYACGQVLFFSQTIERPVVDQLRQALTFHVSFDRGVDADFAMGDALLYTIVERKPNIQTRAGLHAKGRTRINTGGGLFGNALQFTHREAKWLFYKADRNLSFSRKNWSGTVSFWLQLDPEEDLDPGYCDPIQITPNTWNNAAFFVDFDKAGDPRDFRLGAFADLTVWNPEKKEIPEGKRPLLVVKSPPFGREKWTHVVFTWRRFNTGKRDGVAELYLDGKSLGQLTGWNQAFSWAAKESRILIGLNYIGLFDDLACFNRELSGAEVKLISGFKSGLAKGLRLGTAKKTEK